MNRKTQITIETHSITIIRMSGKQNSVRCENCQKNVQAFASREIADALRLSGEDIEALRQTGEIHAVASNNKMVCGNSFAEVLRRINQ